MSDTASDDFAFAEIRAILERRYTRRMRVVKTFFSGLVAFGIIIALAVAASAYMTSGYLANSRYRDVYLYIDSSNLYINMIAGGLITLVLLRFLFVLFEMFVGGAKDRALRDEIEQERTWRLWQLQAQGSNAVETTYQMSDDGEVEDYIPRTKRKRLTEHDF